MHYSKMLISTSRERPAKTEALSHSLSIMAGLVSPVASGFYTFSPMGQRVVNRIESVVRKTMDDFGALEIAMPIMQPASLWEQSGRFATYGREMMQLNDRNGHTFFLAPTQEEMAVTFVKEMLVSYRQLPVTIYQIGEKFRDEKRPRNGIIRTKEFLMKDAYSFDKDTEGLERSYKKMRDAYVHLFNQFNLKCVSVSAKTGEIGGQSSEEFMAFSPTGEDAVTWCMKCNIASKTVEGMHYDDLSCKQCDGKIETYNAIEVGHVFKLGTRYSVPFGLAYQGGDGETKHIEMGCYGLGITRVMAAIIEQNNDDKGIIWPIAVSPFQIAIIPTNITSTEIMMVSEKVHDMLESSGFAVILDDRELSGGTKFKDADLLGFPYKLIVGERSLKEGKLEIEARRDASKTVIQIGSGDYKGKILDVVSALIRS